MRGVNQVTIIGRLGRDPETRYGNSGNAITTLAIATEEQWKDKDSGETQKKTSWHRVKIFGKLAEIAGEYLKKGAAVYIGGKLDYGSYEKDGVTVYTTDIVAGEMQMLGGNPEGGQGGGGQRQGGAGQRNTQLDQRGNGGGNRGNQGGNRQQAPQHDNYDDSDIPF